MNNVIQFNKQEKTLEIPEMVRAKTISEKFDGISQSTIDNWVNAGIITRHRICGSVFYKKEEILELIHKSEEHKKVGERWQV